jgi:demethylmenaquinone methyltransferase/2-methoxy-6-polyprenyl-1,4-benzoquinol methylase
MPFRATFDCLWCGTTHTCRTPSDLEGWAQLCPDCVGKAGDNGFLRFRLHQALTERGQAERGPPERGQAERTAAERTAPEPSQPAPSSPEPSSDGSMIDYYEARASEYDDWYLRRGRYERGAIHDAAWAAELDAAGRWLDGLPITGEIVELAAGTGWWSPLLATKGDVSLYDAAAAPLDRARERLVAHGLRAHLHVRDAWEVADRRVDALFTGFWISHVERHRLADFLAVVRGWLKPGGLFAFIDSLPDPASGAVDHPAPRDDRASRRLDDGRTFTVTKVYYTIDELTAALADAGFVEIRASATGRFFLTVSARVA